MHLFFVNNKKNTHLRVHDLLINEEESAITCMQLHPDGKAEMLTSHFFANQI